ncbi:hypothetical protein [Pseudoalteromonas phage C7]|uniref:hypothetical protein n=1 Tax=Pseudoalteromonas phage C7 TaxID=2510494 RepID=UPI0010181AF3|nr:hypothetical protein PP587_gp73 [Pseudoalteromonas phage C7]QAY18027.1 hypothetical protein [Pseudoalteromonas phage C7]
MTAYDCTNADAVFRFNGVADGKFTYDNIKSYGHTGAVIRLGNDMHCEGGRVLHDSPSDRKIVIIAGSSAGNTYINERQAFEYTSNFILPTGVELIYLNTTSGVIDVDLSSGTFSDIRNRMVMFVVTGGGVNNVSFTIDGGAGSVNGGVSYIWVTPEIGKSIVAVQKASGNWFVG